jgi:hypothetical protein
MLILFIHYVVMHISCASWSPSNGKVYEAIYLRESYREGPHVRKRNIANLTHADPREIAAIELALKHTGDLAALRSLHQIHLAQGLSLGAMWTVAETARRLGIPQALGIGFPAQLALWQVLARVLDQGSRLSAVRLAQVHAAGEVLGLERGFTEIDLCANLTWLSEQQQRIEDRLFARRRGQQKPALFLYDVTSSYLEGARNACGAFGYPRRDGKKGKQPIAIGLWCDEQVKQARQRLGCERVAFVRDRGMIKSGQVKALSAAGCHYITAITKPQIETLLAAGVLRLELFADEICEVQREGVRYVLRRNPLRAEQLAAARADKQACVEGLCEERNRYLREHPRARVAAAEKRVRAQIAQLKIAPWLEVRARDRRLQVAANSAAREEAARLDGCYVIKTDLAGSVASKQVVHDRYKDLAQVEQAFRTCKTAHPETRPIHVRTAE